MTSIFLNIGIKSMHISDKKRITILPEYRELGHKSTTFEKHVRYKT